MGEKIFAILVAFALVGTSALIFANGTYWAHPKYGTPYMMVGDSARLMGVLLLSFALLFFAPIPLASKRFKHIGIACLLLGLAITLSCLVALFFVRTHA